MKHSIQSLCVAVTTVGILFGISVTTKDNYKAIHEGVKPVVQYTVENTVIDTTLLVANNF